MGVARGVVQLLADHITWDGFKIRDNTAGPGMYTSPDHSGYLIRDTIFLDNGLGLHLGASGEHPTVVCRNRFTANNEFTEDGAAVLFADQGVDDVLIEHNKSVDDLTFASIFNSTRVRVTANWIRARVGDTEFPGPASAIFIGAGNDDVVVQKNKVASASGNGIHVTDTNEAGPGGPSPTSVIVRRNKVEHAVEFGIEISATGAGEYQVLANRSRTNGVGIHLGLGTSGVVDDLNNALDNALDCQDESTPLANAWRENVGVSSEPSDPALCTAPTELTQARYDRDHDDDGKDHDKRKHKKHHKKMKKHKKHHRPDPCVCTLPWRF